MNVSLTPQLEHLIQKRVKSGLYHSASEVIREAIRLLEERDSLRAIQFKKLRHDIGAGIKEADEGKLISGEKLFDQIRKSHIKKYA